MNTSRAIFDPDGLRPYVTNWERLARGILQSIQHEVAATGNEPLMQLRDELLGYPGVPRQWCRLDPSASEPLLDSLQLTKGDVSLAFFSTLTTLATPRDTAVPSIRIKCFFPADAATEEFARRRSAAPERVA
jgi:hypothetical protein